MADVTSRLRLVVDSTGLDRAGKKLKDLQRGAKETDDAARRLKTAFAGVASVIGAAFSTQVVFGAIRAFDEAARAAAKVEQAVRSTGGAAGFTAAELKKIAGNLQAITLTDADKFLNEATAQLLTFTNIAGEEFLRTQKAALDLATVLDGDLKSASIQLGKALNDPVANLGALSRSGIQFSTSQKEVIKTLAETGRLAEAQRVILNEIERQYGGQAEAAAKVGSGVLTQLKNIVGDIQELFGEKLVGAIERPATALKDFLAVAENQEKTIVAIQAIAAAVAVLAAPALISGIAAVGGAFAALVSPIGLVAAAVGGLIFFGDDIAKWAFGVEDAATLIGNAFKAMSPIFTAAMETLRGGFAIILDLAREVAGAIQAINDRFNSLISSGRNQRDAKSDDQGLFAKAAKLARDTSPFPDFIPNIIDDLRERGRKEINNDIDLDKSINAFLELNKNARDYSVAVKAAVSNTEDLAIVTSEAAKKAERSAAAIAGMFSELETERAALLAPTEREGDILRETERLLSQHAEYYKSMGADAEKLAQADATRVVDLKEGNKALEARNRLERDFKEQRELIAAAGLGEREERIAREVLEIRREIAGISVDEARLLAEQNVSLDEQLDLIREQRELIEAPFDNLANNLTDAIINGGREGVGGLGKIFKSFFNDLKTSFLSIILSPLRQGLRSISSMFVGAFNGFGDGLFGPLSRTTPPFVPPRQEGLSVDTMTGFDGIPLEVTELDQFGFRFERGFDGFLSRLEKGFDQLATNFTAMFKNIGELFGGISDKLAKTLGKLGAGATAGFAGHALGSGAADLFNGRQGETGGKVGGAVGGGIGFAAVGGPLGAFIGSSIGGFLGDIFGGLFGRKTATGTLNFDTGAVTGKNSKKDSRNERRDIILESSASAVQALADILGASIIPGRSLEVKAGKKSIETQIIDALSGVVINIGAKVDDKDVAGALSTAIKLALSSVLEGGDEQLRRIAEAMASANVPAELLVNSLGDIASIMKSVKEPVSELRQNLETVQQVFADAARASGNFAGAIRELAAAQLEAVQALADNFDKDIKKQLLAINNPLQAQFQDLLEVQADRLKDANALNEALLKAAGQATGAPPAPGQTQPGVPASVPANPRDFLGSWLRDIGGMFDEIDLTPLQSSTTLLNAAADGVIQSSELQAEAQERLAAVMELNTAEIVKFFEEVANSPEGLEAAAAGFVEFREQLLATGLDIARVNELLQTAQTAVVTAFDKQIQTDIAQFLNGPLDQLERLLEAQEKRLQQARALGADLTQVERLTALELRQFFQGLSESALNEVRDFLGLFEEASDAVARNLDLSRQDLRGKADAFANFAQEFASLGTDFRERFVAATPRESLDILRGRANDLLGQIGQGNESAAQALPQVLNNLVENARQTFGNTKGFQEVLDFALDILAQAEQSAIGVKSEAERQIAALDESNDLLSEIRDILSSTQAFNALLQSSASGGIASSAELLALIQQGAGLTPSASNDNAAALSITGLIAQSLQPVIAPLATSIDGFTDSLSEMPYLQRLQIEATNDSADRIVQKLTDMEDLLDRIEIIDKQNLAELERINRAA